jgi:hypothetical protein
VGGSIHPVHSVKNVKDLFDRENDLSASVVFLTHRIRPVIASRKDARNSLANPRPNLFRQESRLLFDSRDHFVTIPTLSKIRPENLNDLLFHQL